MKISFPSEKQTIKTFVANLRRCEGLHSKRPESHFKDVCDEVVETLSKSKIKGFDVFMSSVPKKMGRMASLPSPSREPSIPRNVGTKRKRIIDSRELKQQRFLATDVNRKWTFCIIGRWFG